MNLSGYVGHTTDMSDCIWLNAHYCVPFSSIGFGIEVRLDLLYGRLVAIHCTVPLETFYLPL